MIKKFYSNKAKAGWRENPSYRSPDKLLRGRKQKENEKKYYSWGYDIDLEPVSFDEMGNPLRNRKRDSGFASKDLAQAAAGRLKLAEKNSKYELTDNKVFPPLAEFFQRRIDNISERQERVRAVRVLQLLLDELAEHDLTGMRLNQLKTAHINLYASRRKRDAAQQKKKIKDATINRDLRTVRATLNQASNLYPDLEDYKSPKINFLKVDKSRREKVLSSQEVYLIVANLMFPQKEEESEKLYLSRRRAGLLFALSSVTGARPGELVALREEDILHDLNVLKITGKKTRFKTAKTVRYFPLVVIVRQILAAALAIKVGEFIFSQRGTLTKTYYGAVSDACQAVGLKYGRKTPGGIIPYDLRHTATTLLMQSGADFETVTNLTGQSRHTLWHYTHASRESIDRAANVLGDFGEKSLEKLKDGLSLDTESSGGNLNALIATNKQ